MEGVTVVDHPLVGHKLTLMRDKRRSTQGFRQLLNEIGILLCYEVTRDLPTEMIEIETPLEPMMAPQIAGKKLVFAPILRAGVGFLDGMLELVPSARVAHIGLYRDPETPHRRRILLQGAGNIADRLVIIVDPMLATGTWRAPPPSASRSEARRACVSFACLAAPEGIARCATIIRHASGRRRSTRSSTTTAISCRASATRATACSARDSATGEVGWQRVFTSPTGSRRERSHS